MGRHILFWLVYCSYFYIQSIAPWAMDEFYDPSTYRKALISLYSFIPVCMLSVYVSIYFILPGFIEKKKYLGAIFSFIILFSAGTYINYFAAQHYYQYSGVETSYQKGPIQLGYLNTIWAMIISGIAICIRVTRKLYRQQKEIEEITRQKTRNELNLKKNNMHPGFLYSSLDSIYTGLKENKSSSSSMILVLSNLLSYSLYESKTELVTLQHELNAVADFIALEKLKGSEEISLNIDDDINTGEILVTPMVILSVLQDNVARVITLTQEEDELVVNGVIRIQINYKEEYEPA